MGNALPGSREGIKQAAQYRRLFFRKLYLVFQKPACCFALRRRSPPKNSTMFSRANRMASFEGQPPAKNAKINYRASNRASHLILMGRKKNTST